MPRLDAEFLPLPALDARGRGEMPRKEFDRTGKLVGEPPPDLVAIQELPGWMGAGEADHRDPGHDTLELGAAVLTEP